MCGQACAEVALNVCRSKYCRHLRWLESTTWFWEEMSQARLGRRRVRRYDQNSQGVFRAWPSSATTSAVERTSENRAITLASVALCSSSVIAALASETMTHL